MPDLVRPIAVHGLEIPGTVTQAVERIHPLITRPCGCVLSLGSAGNVKHFSFAGLIVEISAYWIKSLRVRYPIM